MALTNNRVNINDGGSQKKKRPEDEYTLRNSQTTYGFNSNTSTPSYYSVAMPKFQTYTPTSFSGYQTYQNNPYAGYKDFDYDQFNYKDFAYNYQDDPLYQMYSEQYTRKGQQAMDDALTALSARTGGIANSYSQSAAQNSYNSYMADLAAKIPELQQIARQMYDTDRNFAYDQYRDARDVAYNNYLRGYNEDYNNWQNANAINQANVDLANNYNYANWQAQEAARQAAVNMQNDWALRNWQNQQDIANQNVSSRISTKNYQDQLKQMAADYETQLSNLQNDESVEGIIADYLLSSHDRGDEQAAIKRILADAVGPAQDGSEGIPGFTQKDADALFRKYAQNPMSIAQTYVNGRNSIRSRLSK